MISISNCFPDSFHCDLCDGNGYTFKNNNNDNEIDLCENCINQMQEAIDKLKTNR